jgi:hypothetical protein
MWARRELKNIKKGRRKMWVNSVICDRRNNWLLWTIFEDLRRDEAKFLNCCRMSVVSSRTVWEKWVFSTKRRHKYEKIHTTQG